jgi:serine/threonine protein kinase
MPKNHGYSRCVDMWSIGCIAAALLAGSPPFASGKHDDKHSILRLMSRCDLEFMNTNKTWKLVGQRSKDFIRKLLILEEDKRMTATQALAHPWFTNEHHAAAFKALYENAVRDWQPPRKVFKMVERLIPNVTSDLGENGLPKPFLPSAIVSRYFNAPSGSNNQTSTNSLTISQGKRANTPLPTITEEYEMEQYRYSHPARSMHSSVYASMNQLNIPPNEDAPDGTLQHGSESVEQYTYLDIDHTDLNYDRQEQIYESYPESPPDAAIPESVPETPARGVKRRVTSFRAGDFDETDFDSQRSNGSEGFMTAKTFAGEVAKRRRVD